MKYRKAISVGTFVSLLLVAIFAVPVEAPNGPKTSDMLIHIFNSDVAELESFGTSTGADAIDFVDCVLNKTYIERWGMSSDIVLKDYSTIEMFQIDINNQRWPTGVTEPRAYDAASDSYKHYYDGGNVWDVKAKEFRKALAYLADKEGWLNRILEGYGNVQHTSVPVPACAIYTDYADLDSKGLIYYYNPVAAAATFDAAGFTEGTTPNPYYDPATPASAQYLRTDPRYGGDLQPLVFYIRMDDVLRRDVGRELIAQLRKAGIAVNAIETDRTVCYNEVMVIYDYHLYTGSYDATSLDADIPSSLYNLFHSSKYWGGTAVSYYGGLGWSRNYIGFCDTENDGYLNTCKYSGDFNTIKQAALDAQEREAELVHSIPAYARIGMKAYKKGWTGIINQRGWGFDNKWSFLNGVNSVNTPLNPADSEIDYGFSQRVLAPNPVTSYLPQDRQLISSIYESMICRDPYLSGDYGLLAESWTFNAAGQYVLFTLRSGLTFHNGEPVTPEDVKFSIEFNKACGPGVSSAYGNVELVDHVNTIVDEGVLGPYDVKVYLTQASYWSVHLAGFIPILSRDIWMTANTYYGWGYYRGLTDYNLFTNRMLVRNYNPWESDVDTDGDSDFEEDGSGGWIYRSHAPAGPISAATSLSFDAFTGYCVPQSAISDYLDWSYHMLGDVNHDGRINITDSNDIQRALGTDKWGYPWGTGWDEYNPEADINTGTWDMVSHAPLVIGDGYINAFDLGKWGLNVDLYASSITAVEPSKTMVARGESLTIDVSVSGFFPQPFDVTVYHGDPLGYPTIGPSECYYLWTLGDVDRNGYIDSDDEYLITEALYSGPGDTNWNPNADITGDGWVDDWDLGECMGNIGVDIWTLFGQIIIGTQTAPQLQGIGTLTFTWDIGSTPTGIYTIGAYAVPSSEDGDTDNNCYLSGQTVKVTNVIAVYPEITVGPPPGIDETFDLNITVAGVIDLYTWQAGLTFDPSVLEAVSIAEGEFLTRSGVTTLWAPGSIDNISGIIHYSACSVTGDNPGVEGSGQLMSVTFRVKNPGESTLHITDVLFLDSSLTLIEPVDAIDGYVKIHEEDIAVLSVTTSASEAYPTWADPLDIIVVVENQGTRTETFDVTVYADTITIETKPVTLDSGATTTLGFHWDLTGVPEDTYTIRAEATVLYGEVDTADNTLIDGTVTIKYPGDANGDSILNAYDVGILAKAWGTSIGQPLYDPRADFNGDGTIDTLDHDILKAHWP